MYRSQTTDLFSDGRNKNITTTWRATAAYVTGGSSFRFGYIGNQLGDIRSANRSANDLRYRVNNGVPNQLTQYVHDQQNDLWMRNDALLRAAAVDARPPDAAGRAAIRPRVELGAARSGSESRFWAAPLVFEETPVVDSYNDLTPRVGGHLRSVRQRQDRAQGDARQVSRVHRHGLQLRPRQPDVAHRHQRRQDLDRPQQQLEP